jgi:hypothetical protein
VIKSIVVHDSVEIARRYGPWLARHESYLPVDAPADARAFGFYNWRVTEAWWRDVPLPGPQGALSFTLPPAWPTVATCFVPPQPTEDFLVRICSRTRRSACAGSCSSSIRREFLAKKASAGSSRLTPPRPCSSPACTAISVTK